MVVFGLSQQIPWRAVLIAIFLLWATLQFHASFGRGKALTVPLIVPDQSAANIEDSSQQEYCHNTFGDGYLARFAEAYAEYCNEAQSGSLTCFDNMIDTKSQRTDSLCLAARTTFDVSSQRFEPRCGLLPSPKNREGMAVRPLRSLTQYWYSTGPAWIFQHFFNLAGTSSAGATDSPNSALQLPTLILVKREIANFNLWHNVMEVMSAMHTVEVLERARNVSASQRALDETEKAKFHIVILDDEPDGPYLSLWGLITPNPVLRLSNLTANASLHTANTVVPLPGGANPFWQGDWVDIDCGLSPLLQAFSTRVLLLYDIPATTDPVRQSPLRITLVERTTKRRLLNLSALLGALEPRLPATRASIQVIDFATLSLADQVRLAHDTDILVGVHGAGLTHGMFLPPGSAIVEFMPFSLDHRGFQNMAKMLGHLHFGANTVDDTALTDAKGDWQEDDVVVDEADWMREIMAAVDGVERTRAVTSKGT